MLFFIYASKEGVYLKGGTGHVLFGSKIVLIIWIIFA
jgi:hypothetical protein